VSALVVIVVFVAAERLAEIVYAARNTRALLRRGGVECGRGHYPLFVLLHGGWLAALLIFVPSDAPVAVGWLGAFFILQALRFWVIASLGPYWTTRIITLADVPLVRRGPYRFLRHPNYAVVVGEIAVLPLIFGAWRLALIFSVLNAVLLGWRIHVEAQALAPRRSLLPDATRLELTFRRRRARSCRESAPAHRARPSSRRS
jgi:methyltransferase